jgi:hypothetical protein
MSVKSEKGRGTTMTFTIPRTELGTQGSSAGKSGLKATEA